MQFYMKQLYCDIFMRKYKIISYSDELRYVNSNEKIIEIVCGENGYIYHYSIHHK